MLKVKRIVSITLLASALLFPTSAFASTKNNNNSGESGGFQAFTKFVNSFTSNKGDNYDYNNFNKKDLEEASDWYEKNKKDCPPESNIIWKKWFCY